jgi:phage shock protein PspC (stress-responsive transcriptional regulator)
MSGRARGSWVRLVGVAVLMAVAMLLAGFTVLMLLNAVTWTLWDPSGEPPLWLNVVAMTLVVVLAAVPGAVVGLAAGLRRWWLLAAMALSALVGVGAGALMPLLAAEDATPLAAAVGSVAGSLVAVALADRLGGDHPVPRDGAAGRPMRSREERVIAGVCAGWARAHGREPSQVRVLVVVVGVVLAVALPPLALALVGAYVYAWLAWPLEATSTPSDPSVMV